MRGQGSGAACPWNAASTCSLHWPEGSKGGEIKKCGRAGALLSKSNQQYHKLFKDIPAEETVLKVCSCALQRDLLLQGRLYISPNWLCFHASLFGKDIKDLLPGPGLVLPGRPHLAAGAAVVHLHLGGPGPGAQVTAACPSSPLLLQEEHSMGPALWCSRLSCDADILYGHQFKSWLLHL